MDKVKPPLTITQVSEAKVKAVVRKTGKAYYRSFNYAKHIIRTHPKEPVEKAIHEYYLRDGRRWKKVAEEEYLEATSEKAVENLHKKLEEELKHRVQQAMS